MEKYQKRMIEEHTDLVIRIQKLHNWIYSDKSDADNKVEFANKCIQLAAMKKYEEALRARFENAGIVFENGEYFERIATITPILAIIGDKVDSDFDVDAQKNPKDAENNNK